jgi:hypothetical protein
MMRQEKTKILSKEEEALGYLAEPNLTTRIIEDITFLGYAGEDRSKLLAYLVATSRKMENPLACVIRGQSSVGKSYLIDAIVRLIPPKERMILSRATKRAFFYESDLSHKFIYIKEAAGCEEASYAIRTLLSERVLELTRTVGIGVQKVVVKGPVSFAETTAEEVLESQLANRVFEIWIDESEGHTRRIHEMQRERYTVMGLEYKHGIEDVVERHHFAQHLLKPLPVAIPYAEDLEFPSGMVRHRRDHQRFLDLISVSAFLHQYQRQHGWLNSGEYIEADIEDYEIAYWLIEPILLQALNEHGTKPRELLEGINSMIKERAIGENKPSQDIVFTRTDIADFMGWTKRQVRTHIKELEELEAVEVVRGSRGREYKYRLLHEPSERLDGNRLLTPEELREKLEYRSQT